MSKIESLLIKKIMHITKMIEENNVLKNRFQVRRKVWKKIINIYLYDISMNKTENELKDRKKLERHHYSPLEINIKKPENKKNFKGIIKINNKINKKLFLKDF